ncbi:MAG: hypothetical protein QUS11_09150 [Candidatus Fermentibacter sp.]|nr:hypothetical protein [Candidatus Fermentibacter sp.]
MSEFAAAAAVIALALAAGCGRSLSTESPGETGRPGRLDAIGGVAGLPQFFGPAYERVLGRVWTLDVHVGSVVVVSTAGARLSLGSVSEGVRPRISMGVIAFDEIYEEAGSGDDPYETGICAWPSAGLAWRTGGFTALLELGWIAPRPEGSEGWLLEFPSLTLMARF